jgi:hypothetical protein
MPLISVTNVFGYSYFGALCVFTLVDAERC